jgi:hypothetical protein
MFSYWIDAMLLPTVSGSVTSWVKSPRTLPRLALRRSVSICPVPALLLMVATPPPWTLRLRGKSPSRRVLVPSQFSGAAAAVPVMPNTISALLSNTNNLRTVSVSHVLDRNHTPIHSAR